VIGFDLVWLMWGFAVRRGWAASRCWAVANVACGGGGVADVAVFWVLMREVFEGCRRALCMVPALRVIGCAPRVWWRRMWCVVTGGFGVRWTLGRREVGVRVGFDRGKGRGSLRGGELWIGWFF
jgi:hypothetical protein